MLSYAICEIGGKQYKLKPNQPFEIDYQKEAGKDMAVNVLLWVEDGKVNLGNPYLKEKLTLKVLENIQGKKIRVSKFHAKANFRKTTGSRAKLTKVILDVKK